MAQRECVIAGSRGQRQARRRKLHCRYAGVGMPSIAAERGTEEPTSANSSGVSRDFSFCNAPSWGGPRGASRPGLQCRSDQRPATWCAASYNVWTMVPSERRDDACPFWRLARGPYKYIELESDGTVRMTVRERAGSEGSKRSGSEGRARAPDRLPAVCIPILGNPASGPSRVRSRESSRTVKPFVLETSLWKISAGI
eukprot:4121516-Prymnesium_polylepis.3